MTQYHLLSKPLGTVQRYVIMGEDGWELEVLAGWGGGLNAWRYLLDDTRVELLFGYRSEGEFWETQADTSAGERLAPWPGRTNNAEWTWRGKSYKLDNNVTWAKHALHGLLHTKEWKLNSFTTDGSEATLTLDCDWTGNHKGFPFPFYAQTEYKFGGPEFTITSYTMNTGNEPMPYAEGWHPYFMLGDSINDAVLTLPECEKVLVDDTDIPTGERVPETRFGGKAALGEEFVNDCFALKNPAATSAVTLASELGKLTISQKSGAGEFRYVQVYTPGDRKSLAIEPMTAEPDVLNHHRDLRVIEPGEIMRLSWSAKFC